MSGSGFLQVFRSDGGRPVEGFFITTNYWGWGHGGLTNGLSCHVWRQTVRWGGDDVWRLTSASRQAWRQAIFSFFLNFVFGTPPLLKRATRSQWRHSISLPYTWDAQSKPTRQTYRQSIQTTHRQFTKRSSGKRIIRPSKHTTKEIRNIRVKLNWEEDIWTLFITTVNKYGVHTS